MAVSPLFATLRCGQKRFNSGLFVGFVALCALLAPMVALGVEQTDTLDSFDDENDNPFDFSMRLRFTSDSRDAFIGREVKCLAGDALGNPLCPKASGTVISRELVYARQRNVMNIDTRIGLYKDLELYAFFPIVTGDSWNHKYVTGVDKTNSSIAPIKDSEKLFAPEYNSRSRAGFGDMTIGIKWGALNYYRDVTHPTWVWGVDLTLPTGTAMQQDNDGVGLGLYQLHLYTTVSRRTLRYFEPFFNAHGVSRFGAASGLFNSQGGTQPRAEPGSSVGTLFGLTIIPWENIKQDQRFELEGGFGMDYHFRGREYSEIWEAFASSANPCQTSTGCTNTQFAKSDVDPITHKLRTTDGITDIESYGRFTGWAGLHFQPIKYFQISARAGWTRETSHYITYGDPGTDLDKSGNVEAKNSAGKNEFSPVYLPAVDTSGQRLRLQDISGFGFMLAISGKL